MAIHCFAFCGSTIRTKVLRVVSMDGKVLEFKTPLLVKDVPMSSSRVGIAMARSSEEVLADDFELRLGKTYYVVDRYDNLGASGKAEGERGAVKRIKVVITKQQLRDLLANEISMEDVIARVEKRDSPSWKPRLDSILEGRE